MKEGIGELRALANPTRLRLLSLLARGPLSAAEVARRLGIAHGSASFHLRHLAAAGVLSPLPEEARRGGRERRYAYHPEAVHRLAPVGVRPFEAAVVQELRRRLGLPRAQGIPEMISDAEMWVAREDWESALRQVSEILTKLGDRAAKEPAPGLVRGSITALMFPLSGEEDDGTTVPAQGSGE